MAQGFPTKQTKTASSTGVGKIQLFLGAPDSDHLELDGSVIGVAAYRKLVNYGYCGDANNATANWGYRCTNPVSPTTSRSTTGDYYVLPDMRGEFSRIWDAGRGKDTDRTMMWLAQSHQVISHNHSYVKSGENNTDVTSGGNVANKNAIGGSTGNIGGTETRPTNLAFRVGVKFR